MPSLTKELNTAIEVLETVNSAKEANKVLDSLPRAKQVVAETSKDVVSIIENTEDVSVREAAKHKSGQAATPSQSVNKKRS